jgi:polar amino acid transport system substrate-binding protein
MKTRLWILFILIPVLCIAEELLFSFHDGNHPPYAMIEQYELKDGIIRDLAIELSRQLKVPCQFVYTTRKRLDLDMKNGRINVRMNSKPEWTPDRDKYFWTNAYIRDRNLFAGFPGTEKIISLNELKGKRIGTILGFSYPGIKSQLDSNFFIRDDAVNLQSNLERLQIKRIDLILESDVLLMYAIRNQKLNFRLSRLVIDTNDLRLALSSRCPVNGEQMNQALLQLAKKGFFRRMAAKYRISQDIFLLK